MGKKYHLCTQIQKIRTYDEDKNDDDADDDFGHPQ